MPKQKEDLEGITEGDVIEVTYRWGLQIRDKEIIKRQIFYFLEYLPRGVVPQRTSVNQKDGIRVTNDFGDNHGNIIALLDVDKIKKYVPVDKEE